MLKRFDSPVQYVSNVMIPIIFNKIISFPEADHLCTPDKNITLQDLRSLVEM